jgi:hypothetical protein
MFLVNDSSLSREARIKQFLAEDPSLSVLLSVIHFEWTIRRSIIALGTSPNVTVRTQLKKCHGLGKYKELWKEEVSPNIEKSSNIPTVKGKKQTGLPDVIGNETWENLGRAFRLRHRLVHGEASCGTEYAKIRVDWAIQATNQLRGFCANEECDIDKRLPVRRYPK